MRFGNLRGRGVLILLLCALLAVLVTPVITLLCILGYYRFTDTIYPGVSVGGVPVEGLTRLEAASRLERVWNQEFMVTAVDTDHPSNAWVVSPAEFGIEVNPDLSAEKAYRVGRDSGLGGSVMDLYSGMRYGKDLIPWVSLDPIQAQQALAGFSDLLERAPRPPYLALQSGQVVMIEGEPGLRLDVEASLSLLSDPTAILLNYHLIPLVTVPVPAEDPTISDALKQVEGYLSSPAGVWIYDPVTDEGLAWNPTREEVGEWIEVEYTGEKWQVNLRKEGLERYIDRILTELGDEREVERNMVHDYLLDSLNGDLPEQPLIAHYRPTSYIVQPGDTWVSISFKVGIPYWKLIEANAPAGPAALRVGHAIIIPPKDVNLTLPVIADKRIVVSISDQRMWLYERGELIMEHVVSTGIPSSPTMPGVFQIISRYENAYASIWDLYMPHFLGIYNATPNLLNGIHGLPLLSNGRRLWAEILGQPASYGCIILDLDAAEHLFGWAEDGVVVEIKR